MEGVKRLLLNINLTKGLKGRYYCPFCYPGKRKIFQSKNNHLTCFRCGEELIELPIIRVNQVFALITATAFISPLFIMVFNYLQYQKDININQESIIKMKFDNIINYILSL